MRWVTLLCCALLVSCGPHLTKISRDFYVDDVPAGKTSPHLYWMHDDKRVVVDREIQSYRSGGGCIIYETSRPSMARALYGVEPGKTPVAAAASDAFRPWHLAFDGARRFDLPRAEESGVTTLGMDFVRGYKICQLAYNQPPFREDWAKQDSADFTRVEVEHTDFNVNGADSVGNSTLSGAVAVAGGTRAEYNRGAGGRGGSQ